MAIQPQGKRSDLSKKGMQPEHIYPREGGEAVLHFFLVRITQIVVNNLLLKQLKMAGRHFLLLWKTSPVIKQLPIFQSKGERSQKCNREVLANEIIHHGVRHCRRTKSVDDGWSL